MRDYETSWRRGNKARGRRETTRPRFGGATRLSDDAVGTAGDDETTAHEGTVPTREVVRAGRRAIMARGRGETT